MKLRIITPLSLIVDEETHALRAEDGSGSFGILEGHADLLTSLAICVVIWTTAEGSRRYCAVRRGVLTVTGGTAVSIATREAVIGGDPATLANEVLKRFRADIEAERSGRVDSTRLQLSAIRRMVAHLQPGERGGSADFA